MSDPDILTHGLDDPVRLERELHEKGWRPVLMRDEVTGLPFTRVVPAAQRSAAGLSRRPWSPRPNRAIRRGSRWAI